MSVRIRFAILAVGLAVAAGASPFMAIATSKAAGGRTPAVEVGPMQGNAPKSPAGEIIPRDEIITVDKIHPGMEGYGLTVFRGTQI